MTVGPHDEPLIPYVARDETAEAWGESEPDRDEDLRREVPPHHG